MSDFDLDLFFQLTPDDVKAISEEFRTDHRAPVALMVLFMRASGRPLSQFSLLPRNLLRYVGEIFKTAAPTIASLRAIYQRSQTLYKHPLWAKNHLGLKDLDADEEASLVETLNLTAAEAAHADDLVATASHWLFDRRFLIPGPRRIQDWARDAHAAIEAAILNTIVAVVPTATLQRCRDSVYSLRSDGNAIHLEWLKTPSKPHSPTGLAETLEKIQYLKSLTVHVWPLDGVAIPKQRAYAQQIQSCRPAKTRELKESTQAIELVCFLRMTLLELIDLAIQQGARRSQQLLRESVLAAVRKRTKMAFKRIFWTAGWKVALFLPIGLSHTP